MSRTGAVITKAQETPWLLTPAERKFAGSVLEKRACDCEANDWWAEHEADRLAKEDPERQPGHQYATEREYQEHVRS